MKTLKNFKLHKDAEMSSLEQQRIIGGTDGLVWSDEFGCYMLPEVTVYGHRPCSACVSLEGRNNPHGLSGGDRNNHSVLTPLGDILMKYLVLDHDPWCPWH